MRMHLTLIRRLGMALIAMAALAIPLLSVAPSASAAESNQVSAQRNYFGAISVASDGAYGYSYDYGTKKKALKKSFKSCKRYSNYPGTCKKIVWVRNGCAAVNVKYNRSGYVKRVKWGVAGSRVAAKRAARRNFGGKFLASVCTSR